MNPPNLSPGLAPAAALLRDDGWLSPHFSTIAARKVRAAEAAARLTGGQSLWEWAAGHHWYGLHRTADGWVYRDWAPHATALWLCGDFSGWERNGQYHARRTNDHGDWELRLPAGAMEHGQHYQVEMEWPGGGGVRLPAWGRYMHQDERTLRFTARVWHPSAYSWRNPEPPCAAFLKIYEAHPGMALEEARVGTWPEFRRQMLPRIRDAGYDTIQMMGVMEHPYYGSFGYHVGSFFAPSSRFGTPEELMELVDAAHGMGLRVIMDLVHSHSVKNEVEGLSRYDGTPWQYFHDGPRGDHPAWDSRCFNYTSPAVVHFLLSNVRYWLEEFRFDGFRFDGVTSMLYHDHGLSEPFSSYDDYFGPRVDESAITYLTLANRLIHEIRPDAVTVAEDVSGLPGLCAPLEDGGVGFDARLCMGLPECWFKLVKEIRDEDWSMNWLWHELRNHRADERGISYVESHDQALVGGKSFIFEMIDADMYHGMHVTSGNERVARGVALHKMARLATLGAAGHGYLNFMGNEFGHPEWIDFPREGNQWSLAKARRLWSLRDDAKLEFKALADFDAAMLALVPHFGSQLPELIKADDGDKVLIFRRGPLLFVFNFHPWKTYPGYGIKTADGKWLRLLSSRPFADREVMQVQTKEGWLRLDLPPRTAVVMRRLA